MSSRKRAGETLLSPFFLERLRIGRELLFRSHRRGEWRGRGFGQTPEFERNRQYEPGDDLRYLDWNLYARFERLLLKLFAADDEVRVGVLVDASLSMRVTPAKALLAARLGAAFSWLTLASGRTLSLGAYADGLLAGRGPYRSLQQFPAAVEFFTRLPAGKGTDLGAGAAEFLLRHRGRGILVVISDLFQDRDVTPVLDWLRWRRVDVHLVQVVDDRELEPNLRGRCAVSDAEGEDTLQLTVGNDLLQDFRARLRAFLARVEQSCRNRSVPYLRARTSDDFERLFLTHLFGASYDR